MHNTSTHLIRVFLLSHLVSVACVTDEDACYLHQEEVPLSAHHADGNVALAHTPPLLWVSSAEVYWTLPSDAVSVELQVALSDIATGVQRLRVVVAETDLRDVESDSETYESETNYQLVPDRVVELQQDLGEEVRPKSLYLEYVPSEPLHVYGVRVERLLCL